MLGWSVSEAMFSEEQLEQLEQLRSFSEITRDELIKFFTLTSADLAFVGPGRGRGPADRLGLAVQLASLSWLGFVPDESPRRRLRRWRGWLSSWGWTLGCCRGMESGRIPVRIIWLWRRST
jgi:Domain of unknown function (DUF4158)